MPSGSITAVAEPTSVLAPAAQFALTFGPQAALSADGEWINDNPLLYPGGNSAPLFINGGSISLTATPIPVQPGRAPRARQPHRCLRRGQLTSAGALNAGIGGYDQPGRAMIRRARWWARHLRIEMGAALSGYGLFEGGTLAVADAAVCIAVADCSGVIRGTLWMSPAQLAAGGFSNYTLTADQGGFDGRARHHRNPEAAEPDPARQLPDLSTRAR